MLKKSVCVDWREGPGLKRLRKKSIRQHVRNGPGLKPLDFAGIFAGLKSCAPTEKRKACIFPQPVKPFVLSGFFVGLKPHAHPQKQQQRLFQLPLKPCSALLALLMVCLTVIGCAPPRSSRIVIGAKNFTEQVVLGELLAQEIEATTGERVDRRFYLAGSYICNQALVSGRIDGYVEYTGTALTAILKRPLPPVGERDEATVWKRVRDLYASRYGVRVGRGLGFEDTFAMVVRGDDARRLGLKTISDAVRAIDPTSQNRDAGHPWRLGVGYEFEERPDGLRGLEAAYGLRFKEAPRVMDLGLLYRALAAGQVDMVAGNSTDGAIRAMGDVVLEDDRHYFPPYEAVPLVREDSIRRHPGMEVAMERLAGKVSAEDVREMNYAVDTEHREVGDVVREFRRRKGL